MEYLEDEDIKRFFNDWYREKEKEIKGKVNLQKKERDKFVENFPLAKIENKELKLDEYVSGRGEGSFCNFIEFKTCNYERFSIGSASAYGIFYSKRNKNYNVIKGTGYINVGSSEDAKNYFMKNILENLCNLIDYCKSEEYSEIDNNNNFNERVPFSNIRRKIAQLYFPDKFIHINGSDYLRKLGKYLGIKGSPSEIANKSLLKLKEILKENDPYILSNFAWYLVNDKNNNKDYEKEILTEEEVEKMIDKIKEYLSHNPNLILYGPPGTGKTYWVRRYVEGKVRKSSGGYYENFVESARPLYEQYEVDLSRFKSIKSDIDNGIKEMSDDDFEKLLYNILYKGPINLNRPWAHKIYNHPKKTKKALVKLLDDISSGKDTYISIAECLNTLKKDTGIWAKSFVTTFLWICFPERFFPYVWIHENVLKKYDLFIEDIKPDWDDGNFIKRYKVYNESVLKLSKELGADLIILQDFLNDIHKEKIELPEYTEVSEIKPRFITFHQSFSYEEFIEGLTAETNEGEVHYDVKDGIFKKLCINAFNELLRVAGIDMEWDKEGGCPEIDESHRGAIEYALKRDDCPRYYLIIDEINRGNISKIFGELITLLEKDKRLGMENEMTITLPYSGKRFGVPPNLYVIGTMNSTDRSIALIDAALRRRFAFMELEPEKELVPKDIGGIPLRDIFVRMNEKIEVLKDRDHRIGHSYLMDKDDRPLKTVKDLQMRWFAEIIPLLQEYFYNEWEKLKEILGDGFIEDEKGPDLENSDLIYDEDRKVWRIKWELMREDNVEKFKEAMLSIVKGGDEGDKSSSEEEGGEDKEH